MGTLETHDRIAYSAAEGAKVIGIRERSLWRLIAQKRGRKRQP